MAVVEELERGRAAAAAGEWLVAHDALVHADEQVPLAVQDIELLATTAYMLGREDEHTDVLDRAHHLHLDAGDPLRAASCAFWAGMHLMVRGDVGRGSGWLARAQRLVEQDGSDCVQRGYLMMPHAFQLEAEGRPEEGAAVAGQAVVIAEAFGDRDLFGLAMHMQGHLLVECGRVTEGLRLLDEAMVAVTSGELSPIVSGIVYCGVIVGCQAAWDVRRAREWTAALTRWCERQPQMVAFSGRCQVHRAEIMALEGAWPQALEEAARAGERAAIGGYRRSQAEAAYVQGEVHRLRGAFDKAQEAYRKASGYGREPQPGMALLRLAQGQGDAAGASIRRALGETTDDAGRTKLLPAFVEIVLAAGDTDAARSACDELAQLAAGHEAGQLDAIVAQAQGAVDLAAGGPEAALVSLRRAWRLWNDVEAPYEAARVRVLMAAACRALGDDDAAAFELEAARATFETLGAVPDLAALGTPARRGDHGLTPRELEVLRLVAAGDTNKAIAAGLVLSERTVDRHVSNLFVKLGVSSRAAATAYAYEHHLL